MSAELTGRPSDSQLIGYSLLISAYRLQCPLPRKLTVIAAVGQRTSRISDGVEWLLLPRSSSIRVPSNPIEHLGVALKHEGVDLRILHCLFSSGIEAELTAYITANKSGMYTRRAWFLYEWLTAKTLDITEPYAVQYIPALEPTMYFTREPSRSTRHKVDNNMPGVPGFCPLIRRTERLQEERIASLATEARDVVSNADPAVLRRAVGFMLLNESKGSFGIEGENPPRSRLERWGKLIAEARDIELSVSVLEDLHRSLFDKSQMFTSLGLRTIGGFVGRHDARDQTPVPDHVSARSDDLASLLQDLLSTYNLHKITAFNPVLTAAVLGFGFVFIHPFEDGNGRLHRFLIQKALVDTGFNPDGVVLPVSAAILEDLLGYRNALEDYSLTALPSIDWIPTSDGNIQVSNDTAYLYRYFDATRQAEYLAERIERTIRFSVPAELQFLHQFDEAKRKLALLVDMPDRLISLFIQFCIQNGGKLSARKKADYFPTLPDDLIERLQKAVSDSGIGESGLSSSVIVDIAN